MGATHLDAVRDKKGVYYKVKSSEYRANCKSGFLGHRWQAHHILPGTCFGGLDEFVKECLGVTEYDINKDYSMEGMPTLKGFLLYFRAQADKKDQGAEDGAQLARWKKIRVYETDNARLGSVFPYPGDIPCHQPVSFGHYIYNDDVSKKLKKDIWDKLVEKKDEDEHAKPEDIKSQLEAVKDHFLSDLKSRGTGAGGGGYSGVKDNFVNRLDKSKGGWWKPMAMADLPSPPTPPSTYF